MEIGDRRGGFEAFVGEIRSFDAPFPGFSGYPRSPAPSSVVLPQRGTVNYRS